MKHPEYSLQNHGTAGIALAGVRSVSKRGPKLEEDNLLSRLFTLSQNLLGGEETVGAGWVLGAWRGGCLPPFDVPRGT